VEPEPLPPPDERGPEDLGWKPAVPVETTESPKYGVKVAGAALPLGTAA
jgi:hypothetical protein